MGSSYSFGASPTFRYRPHLYRSDMPCFRPSNLGSAVTFAQIAARGSTTTVVGASSATQDVGSTSGWAGDDFLVFINAAGTPTIAQIQSVTDADTVVLKASINTSTGGPWTVRKIGTNQYGIASMVYVDEPMPVKGIILPTLANLRSGFSVTWTLGLWTTVVNTNDWNASALVNANAWGNKAVVNAGSGNRAWGLAFQSTCWVDPGYYFIAGTPRCAASTGFTSDANDGTFETLSMIRGEGVYDSATVGYSRYDQETTTDVTYAATTPASMFSGKAWVDAGLTNTRPQNINFALWLDHA